jgi:hypothetical protein
MTALIVTVIAGTGASTGHLSERAGEAEMLGTPSVKLRDSRGVTRTEASDISSRSEKCHARKGLRFYVRRYSEHAARLGAGRSGTQLETAAVLRRLQGNPRIPCPLYLANVWKRKSFAMRMRVERFISTRTLRDWPFGDGTKAWPRAVREVQRVFPGTESWLLSCSDAEGGHHKWVGYGGAPYSTWLRDSDTVGGPLQFRFSTFTGMFRRAVTHVTARGFRVPRMDTTTAWRSALGQALAGGWARYTGNDNSHWSASWGNGC